ncbi:MAG TPA: hypothetical protein VFI70_05045 [Nitrososphaeraceae archaeon]|nr:hypothetical protein [Nitrososphaeraceae archaeon]
MSIENIDQYIKELTAIKQYDRIILQLAEKEKEIENLKNTLALRDQELGDTRQELSKWKAYAIELNEVKIILDNNNNQNNTSLADLAKAFLNTKQQEIDRMATEKFHILKKKWEDFDKPLEFQSYYDEKIEQKVKEIEDRIGKNVFELLGSQEWKINCNKCGLGHTLKFNAKEISDLFQNGFIDMPCNSNNIPKIPKPPSLPMNPRRNFPDQGQVQPKHTIMITLHSLIQTYLQ